VRAAIYRRTGPAHEVLEVAELPDPVPGPGEVRVRIHASGVNPSDWRWRSGETGLPMPFPLQTPGQDGGGIIDAVGEGVDDARVGQRVWVYHAAFGRSGGTAADYVTLPAAQAVPLPSTVGFDQAAGLGIPFITAHRALLADGPIQDRTVLISGGAGAVGNAAIQLAKRAGARVITTVSTHAKAELAARAGADHIVTGYHRHDAADEIRALAPAGVDRLIEVALTTNLQLDLAVMAPGATIVSYAQEPAPPTLPLITLMVQNAILRFLLVYTTPAEAVRAAADDITAALAAGKLKPLPAHHYPLDDIAAAHDAVEHNITGKVLVDVVGD
jgi:NADPH:quinone reductase